ncbi:MAG: hypothetical protein NVS9B10_22310 [Nevskia sp.]
MNDAVTIPRLDPAPGSDAPPAAVSFAQALRFWLWLAVAGLDPGLRRDDATERAA